MKEINGDLERKYRHLRKILEEMDHVVVAMSGGVDSVLLAKIAAEVLGEKALAVTADSASLPRRELQETIDLTRNSGIRHLVIRTEEVLDPRYAANPTDRCYFCKDILFDQLDRVSKDEGASWVCFGENIDDQNDFRPGSKAATEHSVRAPLKEAGLTKSEIRELARAMGLPVWEKPASACLASRIPYGMTVTEEKLNQVEQAEGFLHSLGFVQCRVRHHGEIGRIEVTAEQMQQLLDESELVAQKFNEIGFTYVTMDLRGYRRGSLNEAAGFIEKESISISR